MSTTEIFGPDGKLLTEDSEILIVYRSEYTASAWEIRVGPYGTLILTGKKTDVDGNEYNEVALYPESNGKVEIQIYR